MREPYVTAAVHIHASDLLDCNPHVLPSLLTGTVDIGDVKVFVASAEMAQRLADAFMRLADLMLGEADKYVDGHLPESWVPAGHGVVDGE